MGEQLQASAHWPRLGVPEIARAMAQMLLRKRSGTSSSIHWPTSSARSISAEELLSLSVD